MISRLLLPFLCTILWFAAGAQPPSGHYIFNSAEYFTYSAKTGDFVPGLNVSTNITISINKEVVKMQTFAISTFKIVHSSNQHKNGVTENGFIMEDVNHNPCLLRVLTSKLHAQEKIVVNFLYNKGSEGFYRNMTEYKNR